MDLLERAPLLDELASVLAATVGGGRVVLVAGEEGILYATLDLDAALARRRLFDPVATITAPTCSAWSWTTAPSPTWSPWPRTEPQDQLRRNRVRS